VDVVFGTRAVHRLEALVRRVEAGHGPVLDLEMEDATKEFEAVSQRAPLGTCRGLSPCAVATILRLLRGAPRAGAGNQSAAGGHPA
jgi:hypothetical protein